MNIKIICNAEGTGKTTYALNKYIPCEYYICDKFEIINKGDVVSDSKSIPYCIIDCVDSMPSAIFNEIINKVAKSKCEKVIIIFDCIKSQLVDCPNFNTLWKCGYIPRNYKYDNFTLNKEIFINFLETNYPEIQSSLYDEIINISQYNFKKIDRLMLHNQLQTDNTNEISQKALMNYIDEVVQEKFKDIPHASAILKKSSIIGEQFGCDALESPIGFGYDEASAYLKQMEDMHGFIRSCINAEEQYEFIFYDVYKCILDSISSEKKGHWISTLIKYYEAQLSSFPNYTTRITILNKMKKAYKLSPSFIEKVQSVDFLLMYEYSKIDNMHKAVENATEIVNDANWGINSVVYAFLQNYRIKTLMQSGDYQQALEILQDIHGSDNYLGSKMYLKYYYAFCLYNTGNIDLSYSIVIEIVNYLKFASGSNQHSQELFSMTYSLMATLQNHLGLEDGGLKYFRLALNNAFNRLEDKTYYYDILKKCGMFYDYTQTKQALEECLNFYIQNQEWCSAGEVCINLATEMMFQECKDANIIKKYFNNALLYFSGYTNEKLAYAKNNFGIYYVIVENDVEKGLKLFKEAVFAGLSNFTYMSIYLNICMCYILLDRLDSEEFLDAKTHFDFANKMLLKRKNRSLYEEKYSQLLNIIVEEHQGKNIIDKCNKILLSLDEKSFFTSLLQDIIKRNCDKNNSFYKNDAFYYESMNRLRCFFAEFRFWE